MPYLLTVKGYNIGLKYQLKDRTQIGRAEDNDICIPQPSVSRYHCYIVKRNHTFAIVDNASTNGIFVNGVMVKEAALRPQDSIQVGDTFFIFEPAFDLKNLFFQRKTICITPPSAETIRVFEEEDLLKEKPAHLSSVMNLIDQITDLLTPEKNCFADTLQNITSHVMELFNADGCLLFLREESFGSLEPMIGSGSFENIPITKEIIHQSYEEKKSLYISATKTSEAVVLPESISQEVYTLAAAPVSLVSHSATHTATETPIGVLCIVKKQANAFSIDDIMRLRGLGKLIAFPIQLAQEYDRLQRRSIAGETTFRHEIPTSSDENSLKIVFSHSSMQNLLKTVKQVAEHPTNVIIEGETGTGKELLARYIHSQSPLCNGPFVAINCAALPDNLVESEMFGYERGAFTGATRTTVGKVEIAHGGTLFLDEISELSPAAQPKLLRFIEDKIFYRVGGTHPIHVDVRIIAATNKNLQTLVQKRKFREDLFFRLNVITISVPPLRERPGDIKALTEYTIASLGKELGKDVLGISDEAMILLEKYPWYGNVRELRNCLERAVILCDSGIIESRHIWLPSEGELRKHDTPTSPIKGEDKFDVLKRGDTLSLADIEKEYIRKILEASHWNQVEAAKVLGIHRNTLRQKIRYYNLSPPE